MESRELEVASLVSIKSRMVRDDMIMRRQEKTAGATGGITNHLTRSRTHDVYNGFDQGAWRKVLARAAFGVLRIFFYAHTAQP